jgi:hypothetical protein
MITPRFGFLVFGVHKDGLQDPLGQPFIDENIIARSRDALRQKGVELVEYGVVLATKEEARTALQTMKHREDLDGIILFSGTWVWAAHLIAAVRDYALTGKGILLWTHPGSQGWRTVGGLVMHGAMLEVGIPHRFVYGAADDPETMDRILSFCQAAHLKNCLNMSTMGVFGGRGMGQTVGVADPSQWMRVFGVDIDTRDTTELIKTAEAITGEELESLKPRIQSLFGTLPEETLPNERSLRLYLAIKKIFAREQWDFYTIQSFPGLGDDYCATCFAQSLMLENGVPTSTLGDCNTALTTFLLAKLSRERVYYGDLQHIDVPARKSRSSAMVPSHPLWPVGWVRPVLHSMEFPLRAVPEVWQCGRCARWEKGSWPDWEESAGTSPWWWSGSPSLSLPKRSFPGDYRSVVFPSGPMDLSPCMGIWKSSSRPGPTSMPAWGMEKNSILPSWTSVR